MGSSFSSEQEDERGTIPWPENKRNIYNEVVNSGNPKVIDYKQFKFPIEDPVQLTVHDNMNNTPVVLRSYRYPAFYDEKQQSTESSQNSKNHAEAQQENDSASNKNDKNLAELGSFHSA